MRCMCVLFLGLIGWLAYSANSAMTRAVSINHPMNETVVFEAPASENTGDSGTPSESLTSTMETVAIGSTRDQVVALLGHPASIDMKNDRWTYSDMLIIFKNETVAGLLPLNSNQVANLKASDAVPAQAKSRTSKQPSAQRVSTPKARPQYRSAQHFWEPMYRPFYSNQSLARGQSHVSRRWVGLSPYQEMYYQRPYRR